MKSNLPDHSPLRQLIDMLGAQLDNPTDFDPALVRALCAKLVMAASDKSTPIPDDIFAPGVHDVFMRLAIGQLALTVAQSTRHLVRNPPLKSK